MNILVVADVESKYLWDYFDSSRKEQIDLIISCGDLEADYLSFLTTMYHCDVLYVHGNHDENYVNHPPQGCICIDGQVINYQGIRILGLGGSMHYNGGTYQYTEKQMKRRYQRTWFQIQKYRGFDILVTHAPARGIHDGDDLPHRGFECFCHLIEKYQPSYFLHGHIHMNYGHAVPRIEKIGRTTVINGFEKYQFTYQKKEDRC